MVIISSPPRRLAQTLAPLLESVDAGDEVLRYRNLSDAAFMPAADIVFSAAAVGVFRHQVRAREIGLLGLLSPRLAVRRAVNKTQFLPFI